MEAREAIIKAVGLISRLPKFSFRGFSAPPTTGRTAETTVRSVKTISADGSRVARLRAPFNEEGEVEEEGDGRWEAICSVGQ